MQNCTKKSLQSTRNSIIIFLLYRNNTDKSGKDIHNHKEEHKMAQVNKDMLIADVLKTDENMAGILMREGMHCVGCPAHQMESLGEAAMVHGIDPDTLVARLNAFLEASQA